MKLNDIHKVALLSALLGLASIYLFLIDDKVPPKSELTLLQGKIGSVKATGRYSDTLRFKFLHDDTWLVYHSIGGQTSKTLSALRSQDSTISVLYDQTDSHSPPFDENSYHTIFELVKDGETVQSYESMVDAYASNSSTGGWLGLGFLSLAGILLFLTKI